LVVSAALARRAAERASLWTELRTDGASTVRVDSMVLSLLAETLTQLYPEPAAFLRGRLTASELGKLLVV
jgi:hypothetical protein